MSFPSNHKLNLTGPWSSSASTDSRKDECWMGFKLKVLWGPRSWSSSPGFWFHSRCCCPVKRLSSHICRFLGWTWSRLLAQHSLWNISQAVVLVTFEVVFWVDLSHNCLEAFKSRKSQNFLKETWKWETVGSYMFWNDVWKGALDQTRSFLVVCWLFLPIQETQWELLTEYAK